MTTCYQDESRLVIPSDSIEIRKYKADVDKNYVYATWLQSYKYSSYFAKRIRHHVFFGGHQAVIDHLIAKQITILIASPKGDPDTILGYLAYEHKNPNEWPVVHFTFVKDAFRRMGVARALFEHAKIEPNKMRFTHWTLLVDEFINRWEDMLYDPYKL